MRANARHGGLGVDVFLRESCKDGIKRRTKKLGLVHGNLMISIRPERRNCLTLLLLTYTFNCTLEGMLMEQLWTSFEVFDMIIMDQEF